MDLVVPAECAGCGRSRTTLCARCERALHGGSPRLVRPVPEPPGLPAVHAAAPYADEVRAVLLAHKERGALGLAAPLGRALAGAVRAGRWQSAPAAGRSPRGLDGCWLLVPVPSARRAVRARGHDAACRIAYAAAGVLRRSGAPVRVLAALRQRRGVADQSRLGPRQRRANLAGALEVTAGAERLLRGARRIVLVDDLMTTGASLAEAARAVRTAGVEGTITAAVIAAAPGSFGKAEAISPEGKVPERCDPAAREWITGRLEGKKRETREVSQPASAGEAGEGRLTGTEVWRGKG